MNKIKNIISTIFCFVVFSSILLNVTYSKYDFVVQGEAWVVEFTKHTIVGKGFVVKEEDFENLDRIEGPIGWGTLSDDPEVQGKSMILTSLNDKAFQVQNISSRRLIILIEVIFDMSFLANLGSNFSFKFRNDFQGVELNGYFTTNQNEANNTPGAVYIDDECILNFIVCVNSRYTALIDPRNLTDENGNKNTALVEQGFVVEPGASSTLNLSIVFSSTLDKYLSSSQYRSVRLIAVEYE